MVANSFGQLVNLVFHARIKRTRKVRKLLRNHATTPFHYAFIDEKWFYTTSRRYKMKILPCADHESAEDAFDAAPKIRSCQYPCKVMYMGVIASPVPDKAFTGKIMIKRVSKEEEQKCSSFCQIFSDNYKVSHKIKNGDWCVSYHDDEDQLIDDFLYDLGIEYKLEDAVTSHFVLSYPNYSKTGKTKTIVRLCQNKGQHAILKDRTICLQDGTVRPLSIQDLELHVERKQGDKVQKDITCNSQFMLDVIDEIRRKIWSAYHWLNFNTPTYLFIDNTGGYGTVGTKEEYEQILLRNWNVKIFWQPPNSPEVNQLDLGTWMSIQSNVEELHKTRHMKVNVLAKSVEEAFRHYDSYERIMKIDKKWKLNMQLILLDKGGNDLIEHKRGKNSSFDDLPTVPAFDGYSECQGSEDEVNDD
jgi:hypothetical protein